jgi:hypothetical protein
MKAFLVSAVVVSLAGCQAMSLSSSPQAATSARFTAPTPGPNLYVSNQTNNTVTVYGSGNPNPI